MKKKHSFLSLVVNLTYRKEYGSDVAVLYSSNHVSLSATAETSSRNASKSL
ncbi:MAG: hypothetical protein ACKPKO_57120 [Candidatus Fonsibacter sp.]